MNCTAARMRMAEEHPKIENKNKGDFMPDCLKKHPQYVRTYTREFIIKNGKEVCPLICDKCNIIWYPEVHKKDIKKAKSMKSEPKIIDLLKEKDEEIERLNQLLGSWASDNDRLKSELRLLSEENKELKKQIEKLKSEKAKLIKAIKQRVWNKAIKPFRTEGVLELLKGDER